MLNSVTYIKPYNYANLYFTFKDDVDHHLPCHEYFFLHINRAIYPCEVTNLIANINPKA